MMNDDDKVPMLTIRLLGFKPHDLPTAETKLAALRVAVDRPSSSSKYDAQAMKRAASVTSALLRDAINRFSDYQSDVDEASDKLKDSKDRLKTVVTVNICKEFLRRAGVFIDHLELAPHEPPAVEFTILDGGTGEFYS